MKGSNNRKKWKLRLGRAYERVWNLRNDFLHKFSREVVSAYSVICVEELSLKGLTRTRLAKSFHDAAIGKAVTMLEQKAEESGGIVQIFSTFSVAGLAV